MRRCFGQRSADVRQIGTFVALGNGGKLGRSDRLGLRSTFLNLEKDDNSKLMTSKMSMTRG